MKRGVLTKQEKKVMFEGDTEAPFSGDLLTEKRPGMYSCKNCGLVIFNSAKKYDSKSGWPSFTKPIDFRAVTLLNDETHGMTRVEVRCAKCDAHLGHVFPDGPEIDGGDRYCINSVALQFHEAKR